MTPDDPLAPVARWLASHGARLVTARTWRFPPNVEAAQVLLDANRRLGFITRGQNLPTGMELRTSATPWAFAPWTHWCLGGADVAVLGRRGLGDRVGAVRSGPTGPVRPARWALRVETVEAVEAVELLYVSPMARCQEPPRGVLRRLYVLPFALAELVDTWAAGAGYPAPGRAVRVPPMARLARITADGHADVAAARAVHPMAARDVLRDVLVKSRPAR